MSVHKAAPRILMTLALGCLLAAGPALADDDQGYLGVMLQDLSPSMAKALQLGEESGVLINDVVDDSPAAKAGLQAGDVVVEFGGKSVADSGDLTSAVRDMAPGAKVDVVVLRDGKRQTIAVELGEREDTFSWVGKDGGDFKVMTPDDDVHVMLKNLHEGDHDFAFRWVEEDRGHLGVHIDDLNAQLGEHFGVKDGNGVLITEVVEDGAAAKAGLKAGDVIVGIGDEEVEATDDLFEALAETKAEDKVEVRYVRNGKQSKVEVTLDEAPEMTLGDRYFFGGGDDEFHIMAPKMMYRHMPPMGKHDVRVMRVPRGRVEVIDEMDGDMQELHEELQKLRSELDQLKKELKK